MEQFNTINDGINCNGVIGAYKGTPLFKVYTTLTDFDHYIKSKLTKDGLDQFKDCTFVPVKLGLNETDMSIEALIVPVKKV